MRIEHKELVHLVTQHFHIGSAKKMDDLTRRDQQQIAIAVLKDHEHFDSCEILLYEDDPAKNMIAVLEAHHYGRITAEEVVDQIYDIIINAGKPEIDEIFEEFANNQYWATLETAKEEHASFLHAMQMERERDMRVGR